MSQHVPGNIFRQYDIRGIVEGERPELTLDLAEDIGRAYGSHIIARDGRKVVVGYDSRPSAPDYHDALVRGIAATGCDVHDIGAVPTPVVWFSIGRLGADGGAMVTASHKEQAYNGVKMRQGQEPLVGDDIRALLCRIRKADYAAGSGRIVREDTDEVLDAYVAGMVGAVELERPLKVVVDLGRGIPSRTVPRALGLAGCETRVVRDDWTGSFPEKPLDPAEPDRLDELCDLVRCGEADVGLAFDADGDRLGIVDESGIVVPPDIYVIPLCREILDGGPAKFVFDVRCSMALIEDVTERGGDVIPSPCGYPSILANMARHNAALGAETTGHAFLAELTRAFDFVTAPYDDALFAAMKFLQRLAATGGGATALVEDVPRYHMSLDYRLRCPDAVKFDLVREVRDRMRAAGRDVNDIDGVRIDMEGGWGLLRASNTGPELTIKYEARTPALYREIGEAIADELSRFDGLPDEGIAHVRDLPKHPWCEAGGSGCSD